MFSPRSGDLGQGSTAEEWGGRGSIAGLVWGYGRAWGSRKLACRQFNVSGAPTAVVGIEYLQAPLAISGLQKDRLARASGRAIFSLFISNLTISSSQVPINKRSTFKMAGGAVIDHGTSDVTRIEAPVTMKTYLMCAFAAFGGIFFGYDTGWMGGVLGMPYFISQYTDNVLYPGVTADNIPSTFALPAAQKSLMTSILSAGTFFGALASVSLIPVYDG